MTARVHPESLPPAEQTAAAFAALGARLRRLEAAVADTVQLPAFPAQPASTTSVTGVALYTIPPTATDQVLAVTVVGILTDPTASAQITLTDASGTVLAQSTVIDSQPVTLTAPGPGVGPFTISGSTSTGTLSVAIQSVTATAYMAAGDADTP